MNYYVVVEFAPQTSNFANKSTIIVIHKASFPHIVRGSKKAAALCARIIYDAKEIDAF